MIQNVFRERMRSREQRRSWLNTWQGNIEPVRVIALRSVMKVILTETCELGLFGTTSTSLLQVMMNILDSLCPSLNIAES